jgi:hypothetical protein
MLLEKLLFNHKGHKGLHKGAQRGIYMTFVFLSAILRAPSWLNTKLENRNKIEFNRIGIVLIIIVCCLPQFLQAVNCPDKYPYLSTSTDTIPGPPPGQAEELTGPSTACVGDIAEYSVDVPVACTCQWTINGVIQSETGSPLTVTWTQPGTKTVAVVFVCAGGQTSDPEMISVSVFETPEQPGPISGDEYVCEYTYHTYSTDVEPFDSCEWTVNGVIQPGYAPEITYSFGGDGTYLFEVIAYNPCGTSIARTLTVTANGSAPPTPTPILGPDESCKGETEIYTTTVGPGESCLWWINGLLQPTITTTLEVSWTDWGDKLIEVRAVSDCGTGNPAVKNVLVMYQPSVFLGNDTTIMIGQTLVLDAGNPGSDYLWSTGETTQTLPVSISGTYSVIVSSFCGADADTIEVSVYVGLVEFKNSDDCFRVISHEGTIIFPDSFQKEVKIQLVNLSGMVYYEGPPKEIKLAGHGIWLIRFISPDRTCYRKILIF